MPKTKTGSIITTKTSSSIFQRSDTLTKHTSRWDKYGYFKILRIFPYSSRM
ncbi:MAG TPA: hypothetical protein PLZ65_00845 [Limnochordia bacterium]|nr:hypothetical protein [Limnochordia bacterium]